ncbi:MAG: hypothetical protein QXP41_00030 [Candidatus Nitrosocaldus sp.]
MVDSAAFIHSCIIEWIKSNPFLFNGYEARSYGDRHGMCCDFNKRDTGINVMRMTFTGNDRRLSDNETHIWMSTQSKIRYDLVGTIKYASNYIEISIFKQRHPQSLNTQYCTSRISVDKIKLSIADPEFFNNLKNIILFILNQ